MPDINATMHKIQVRLGLCPRPFWELAVLPQTIYLDLWSYF